MSLVAISSCGVEEISRSESYRDSRATTGHNRECQMTALYWELLSQCIEHNTER